MTINIKIGGVHGNAVIRDAMGDFVGGTVIKDYLDDSTVVVLDSDLLGLIAALKEVQEHVKNTTEGDE